MTALDISAKAFDKGREKCQGLPVVFVEGDACAMTYPDGYFDLVAVANSLHHIPDLQGLFSEMRRVVKPGGLMLISEMYNDGQPDASRTHWILHSLDCDHEHRRRDLSRADLLPGADFVDGEERRVHRGKDPVRQD